MLETESHCSGTHSLPLHSPTSHPLWLPVACCINPSSSAWLGGPSNLVSDPFSQSAPLNTHTQPPTPPRPLPERHTSHALCPLLSCLQVCAMPSLLPVPRQPGSFFDPITHSVSGKSFMSVPLRKRFCLLFFEESLEQCIEQSRCSINVEGWKAGPRAVGL